MTLPYFQHSLELLLHEVLEEEATSTEPIPDALLPSVVDFIQEFPVFHKTIGRCARKTEVALWQHLFSVVGSPRALFLECLSNNDLETAGSYLLILQNLEPPAVAQNHATLLLDAALEKAEWDLSKELVRFLRTIDPEDVGELRNFGNMGPASPPINPITAEEEISLLLGTLQVPRGRTASITPKAISPKEHRELQRSNSESKKERVRKPSSSSGKSGENGDQSAEDFYIDVILQRHARKLLADCRLKDLGTFAAQLDFQTVSWLKRESCRAARMDNFVQSLKRIHADFAWPFPILINNLQILSQSNRMPRKSIGNGITDSGYLSHVDDTKTASKHSKANSEGSSVTVAESQLSEQTIHAMLRPLSFREDLSVLSEDVGSLTCQEEQQRIDSPTSDWSSSQQPTPTNDGDCFGSELVSKGPPKSEVQLRYVKLSEVNVQLT